MLSPVCALLLLGAALATAAPRVLHVLHEKRNESPHSLWKRHSTPLGHEVLPLRIGLKQCNLEHAERYIEDISHPSSANFGKHWSAEKVAQVFAPAKETRDGIVEWLTKVGIDAHRLRLSAGRNWIELNATVAEAESLLNTEYHVYQHSETDSFRVACDSYGLPAHVQRHVDFVMPTIQLDGLQPSKNAQIATQASTPATGLTGAKNCSELITIDCIRALYHVPKGHLNNPSNVMGLAEWGDYLYEPDLDPWFRNFTRPQIPAGTRPEFISIDGGRRANLTVAKAGLVFESTIDFQLAYSVIWPQQARLYQNGDSINVDSSGTFNVFLDALDASYCTYLGGNQPYIDPAYPDPNNNGEGYQGPLQCGGAPKSNVISISYNQVEAALPVFYQQRQCYEWMKLALQGTTVVMASGDTGVANRYNAGYNRSCVNSEYGYVDNDGDRFSPAFPVNCPYITAVGGTFPFSNDLSQPESAVNSPYPENPDFDYTSGGGFSDVFPVPSWQKKATQHYLKHYAPKYGSRVFNDSGHARGYPDISAVADKLAFVYLNQTKSAGGTSGSAPIVGGIITLLNEERLAIGKGPIGFLNPILYAHPEMLNDITNGSNPGCGTQGFPAAPGWDPVTGMGTPNYPKMKKIFLSLP